MKNLKTFINESIKNEDLFDNIENPEETLVPNFCDHYDAEIKNKIITFDDRFGPVVYDEDWIGELEYICKILQIKKVIIDKFICRTSKRKLDFRNIPFELQTSACFCGDDQKLVIENLNLQAKSAEIEANSLKECTFKNSNIQGLTLHVEDCEVKFDKLNNNQFARARYRIFYPGPQEDLYDKASEAPSIEQRDEIIKDYIKSINLNLKKQGSNKAEFILEKCRSRNRGIIEVNL